MLLLLCPLALLASCQTDPSALSSSCEPSPDPPSTSNGDYGTTNTFELCHIPPTANAWPIAPSLLPAAFSHLLHKRGWGDLCSLPLERLGWVTVHGSNHEEQKSYR